MKVNRLHFDLPQLCISIELELNGIDGPNEDRDSATYCYDAAE